MQPPTRIVLPHRDNSSFVKENGKKSWNVGPHSVCVYGMGGKVKEKKKETLRTVSWPTHTIPSTTWNAIWKFLLLLPATRKPKQQQPTTLYIRLTQAITYASKGIYERREESVVCTSRRDVSRATIIGRVPPPNRILLLFSLCIHIERVVNRSKNHERHSYLVPKKGTKISSFYFAFDVLTFLDGVTSRLDTPILLFHIWMRKCFCFFFFIFFLLFWLSTVVLFLPPHLSMLLMQNNKTGLFLTYSRGCDLQTNPHTVPKRSCGLHTRRTSHLALCIFRRV